MKNIKSLLVALVLVAVAVSGFNSVASAAGSRPITPSNLHIGCYKNPNDERLVFFSWYYPSPAKVDRFTVRANGDFVNDTTNRYLIFKLHQKNSHLNVRAWLNGVSSEPANIDFIVPGTCLSK